MRTHVLIAAAIAAVAAVAPLAGQTRNAVPRLADGHPDLQGTYDLAREDDPGFEGNGAYDDPERRPLGERCLMGFGSTSGPPILPNYFYNNLHQIVQTRDSVVILTEMVHDARMVRMNAEHLPKTITKGMGDSVGRWE